MRPELLLISSYIATLTSLCILLPSGQTSRPLLWHFECLPDLHFGTYCGARTFVHTRRCLC